MSTFCVKIVEASQIGTKYLSLPIVVSPTYGLFITWCESELPDNLLVKFNYHQVVNGQ